MTTESNRSRNLLVSFPEPVSADAVEKALKAAGTKPNACRVTTPNHEGLAMTELLAAGIWNQESRFDDCDGNCPHDQQHVPWERLSEEQKTTFTARYAEFIANCTQDELMLDILLQDCPHFENVAVGPHPDPEDEEECEDNDAEPLLDKRGERGA